MTSNWYGSLILFQVWSDLLNSGQGWWTHWQAPCEAYSLVTFWEPWGLVKCLRTFFLRANLIEFVIMMSKIVCPSLQSIEQDVLDLPTLISYVSYARKHIHPQLSDEAAEELTRGYVDLRRRGNFPGSSKKVKGLIDIEMLPVFVSTLTPKHQLLIQTWGAVFLDDMRFDFPKINVVLVWTFFLF